MKKIVIIAALLLPITVFCQSQNWTYLLKGTSDNNKACYEVIELTVHDNQTFTSIRYGCGIKKDWKNYKKWQSKILNGHTSKDGEFTLLTEYRNGFKTDNSWQIKISERSVIYYDYNVKGQLKRKAKYKRSKI